MPIRYDEERAEAVFEEFRKGMTGSRRDLPLAEKTPRNAEKHKKDVLNILSHLLSLGGGMK